MVDYQEDSEMYGDEGWDDIEQDDNGYNNALIDDELQTEAKKTDFHMIHGNEIQMKLEDTLTEANDLFAMDKDSLIIALRHFTWNIEKMQASWFDKQAKLEMQLGLVFDKKLANKGAQINASTAKENGGYCITCYEVMQNDKYSMCCGHQFCGGCWTEYLSEKVNSGFQGFEAKCMQVGCNMMVGHSMFLKFLSQQDLRVYWKWLCKSYTDDNKSIKWCPEQGCQICFERTMHCTINHVDCECGNQFCFLCGRSSHKPCDCDIASKWDEKNSAESENMTWIMANTKSCPKCKRPIEKNQGCNHMTCQACKAEFCWVCMNEWQTHGSATGGYYKCNKYEEKAKEDKDFKKKESEREKAKHELEKYMFYYERYANHNKSERMAKLLKPFINDKIQLLHQVKNYPVMELEFLHDAINEVIRCRQVLKWSYAYGYYMKVDKSKKDQFEFWQEDLEKYCDTLHGLVEKPLDAYLDPNITDRSPFFKFKGQLISYFSATKQFYQSLLKGLEEESLMM